MKKTFSFTARVWKWPGDTGWHFVHVPKDLFSKIREKYGKGMIKITATVGKTSWQTALFPHIRSGAYLLSIKQAMRKKEDLWEGDEVRIKVEIKEK